MYVSGEGERGKEEGEKGSENVGGEHIMFSHSRPRVVTRKTFFFRKKDKRKFGNSGSRRFFFGRETGSESLEVLRHKARKRGRKGRKGRM